MELRNSDTRLFILKKIPKKCDQTITGCRLPTYKQVLFSFIAFNDEMQELNPGEKGIKREAARKVSSQVKELYSFANINTITQKKIEEKIINFYEKDFKNLQKINNNDRKHNAAVIQFQNLLIKTMPFWPKNVFKLLKNENDAKFLESMMTDRIAIFAGRDSITIGKANRKMQREERDLELSKKEEERKMLDSLERNASLDQLMDVSSESDDYGSDSEAALPTTSRSHHRTMKTGTTIHVPFDICKHPAIVGCSVRNNVSPVTLSALVRELILACGGDASKINLHHSQALRYRTEAVQATVSAIKEQWQPPLPGTASLHWDGKLMTSLDSKENEERLPILVSGPNGIKLLGAPRLPTKSSEPMGELISSATEKLLDEWNCKTSVGAMVFDTTSSNTGHVTAGCISIQNKLNKALLWHACRHHIGELIVGRVFVDLQIETSKSPDIMIFKKFKESFKNLPFNDLDRVSFAYKKDAQPELESYKDELIVSMKSVLKRKNTPRDDYKELIELTAFYLQEDISDVHREFRFLGCGPMHKARWMAKLIYAIKISLLSEEILALPLGHSICSRKQINKIERFVKFVVFIYVQWWVECGSSEDAPCNDAKLLQKIICYKEIDAQVSESALYAFKKHLWYLTEESVPMMLFSTKVNEADKEAMVKKLLSSKTASWPSNRYGTGYGKPTFPDIEHSIYVPVIKYDELVGSDSWYFFKIMNIDTAFLSKPVATWITDETFLDATEVVKSLMVTNDCAERGVKLTSDFIGASRLEGNFQNMLQVVEYERNKTPNQRKRPKLSL